MSAMAMGKDEGPNMSICNPCVEKLQKNTGARRIQTHVLQTVTECFYLHAHRAREGSHINREIQQGMYILPTQIISVMRIPRVT